MQCDGLREQLATANGTLKEMVEAKQAEAALPSMDEMDTEIKLRKDAEERCAVLAQKLREREDTEERERSKREERMAALTAALTEKDGRVVELEAELKARKEKGMAMASMLRRSKSTLQE